jgi:hypothetical protein
MPNFIPATGCTLHLVAVWVNRIGKGFSTHSAPYLELIIDENGTPSIGWYQLSLSASKCKNKPTVTGGGRR